MPVTNNKYSGAPASRPVETSAAAFCHSGVGACVGGEGGEEEGGDGGAEGGFGEPEGNDGVGGEGGKRGEERREVSAFGQDV